VSKIHERFHILMDLGYIPIAYVDTSLKKQMKCIKDRQCSVTCT